MKKIEAVIRHYKLEDVKNALTGAGVVGMTVTDARGFGPATARSNESYRGADCTVDFAQGQGAGSGRPRQDRP